MPHTGEKTTPAEALPVLGKDHYLHPQHAVHIFEIDNLISIFWFTSENTVFKIFQYILVPGFLFLRLCVVYLSINYKTYFLHTFHLVEENETSVTGLIYFFICSYIIFPLSTSITFEIQLYEVKLPVCNSYVPLALLKVNTICTKLVFWNVIY